MTDRTRGSIVSGVTTFLLLATAAQASIALLYTRGVSRVIARRSIEARYVRVLARPIVITAGQPFPRARLAGHLRAIGYYEGCVDAPGCYLSDDEHSSLTIWARYPELPSVTLQWNGDTVSAIASTAGEPRGEAVVEPQTLVTVGEQATDLRNRASYDPVPTSALAGTPLLDAIVASEDGSFSSNYGIDFARLALTPFFRTGASTITMQVARLNVLQNRSRTLTRKLNEIGVAMAIGRRFSKDEILDAYVNTVGLGARGGRPIHGFGAAAREFFGVRDVRQLTDLQAATLVALLNQPSRYLDHLSSGDDARLRRQRNRVLALMHRNLPSRYSAAWVKELSEQPVVLAAAPSSSATDSLPRISRHFLDYAIPGAPPTGDGRIYLTLDADRQRFAAEAIEQGLSELQERVSPRARSQLQAALIATDPQTGEVVAMVGGRSYDDSQLNRAISSRRQIGSIMKPFDYLAALERARADGRSGLGPDTAVVDRPTVFTIRGWRPWQPANYGNDYAGTTTWRRALAESRNVAAVKVAALAGFDRVAALWEAASGQRVPQVFPSLALGSIEATPAEVATAYSMFAAGGVVHPLRAIGAIAAGGRSVAPVPPRPRAVAHAETAGVIADMLRAVIDEGTGRGARAAGFSLDAAGKTGTTNALRDAWFAGFSGNLLTVVWVGCDDDRPLGLTGAQAALPIWTAFMKRALQPAIDSPH